MIVLKSGPGPYMVNSYGQLTPPSSDTNIQGVPYVRLHFVFANFSGSGAGTEELLTCIQQPWKFATS